MRSSFPAAAVAHGSGKAALKIQVLWELRHGRLQVLLEPGRASDAKSPITEVPLPAGSLSIFDLGYFSVERFERVGQAKGYWLSRLQHGTAVCDAAGKPVALRKFLAKNAKRGVVDVRVQLGEKRLPCRLVAVRVSPEIAARRRQKIREKARDHGREPSQEYLALQEWTIFVTNCPRSLLKWKEIVVLYRARWQIERLFKLWKSYNHLADRDERGSGGTATGEGVCETHRRHHPTRHPADGRLARWPAKPLACRCEPATLDRTVDRRDRRHAQAPASPRPPAVNPWPNRPESALDENIRVVSNS